MRFQKSFAILLLVLMSLCVGCGKEKPAKPSGNETTVTPVPSEGVNEGIEEPALSGEAQSIYQLAQPNAGEQCIEVVIRGYGSLHFKLFASEAPKAVENLITLAEQGAYDGVKIGTIIDDYMFQAGDIDGTGASGDSIFGSGFENELSEKLLPVRGALCMANEGIDGTNTDQFFVVQTPAEVVQGLKDPLDNRYHMTLQEYFEEAYGTTVTDEQLEHFMKYGGAPWLTGHHTVFGQLYDGYEVLDKLMKAKVTSKLKPNPSVYIDTIRVYRYGE